MAMAKKVFATVSDVVGKKLEQRADEEGRSLSNLISYLLERSMEEWEPSRTQKTPTQSQKE